MWESLVCFLKGAAKNPKNVYEAHGRYIFRGEVSYSFIFKVGYWYLLFIGIDWNCSTILVYLLQIWLDLFAYCFGVGLDDDE